MADLAFTAAEARELLTGTGVDLSEAGMDAVISRTQGWAAGLRMAAMSLAHRTDREDAARELAGNTGTVAEYLLAEVLDTQPQGLRRLLLETSVVDVLRPGLAAALAGPHAERALSFLVHGNAFLEELPELPGLLPLPPALPRAAARPAGVRGPGPLDRAAPRGGHLAGRPRPGRGRRPARDGHRRLGDRRPLRRGRPLGAAAADRSRDRPAGRSPGAGCPRRPRARPRPSSLRLERLPRTTGAVSPRGSAGRDGRRSPAGEPWPAAELAVSLLELVLARRAGDADAALDAAAPPRRWSTASRRPRSRHTRSSTR